MNTEEFTKKAKTELRRFSEVSKDFLEKTGDKVQKFADETVVKIEKNKLETQRSCKYEELGLKLSGMLLQGAKITSASKSDLEIIDSLQKEIGELSFKIQEKENLINEL